MEWFVAVVVVAILGVTAMAAAGGMGEMASEPVRDSYRQDLPEDRPLAAADLQTLRFAVTLRGYAMAQVDEVLDRLSREIAERDARIHELSGVPDEARLPAPTDAGGTSVDPDGERLDPAPQGVRE